MERSLKQAEFSDAADRLQIEIFFGFLDLALFRQFFFETTDTHGCYLKVASVIWPDMQNSECNFSSDYIRKNIIMLFCARQID